MGNALTTNNWYDASGNLIKSIAAGAGKVHTKHVYDGLGRAIRTYSGYDTSETNWSNRQTPGPARDARAALRAGASPGSGRRKCRAR